MLDYLCFICTTPYGFSEEKFEYYKEQLLVQHSYDNMVVELDEEEVKILSSPSLNSLSCIGPMNSAWPMKCYNTHHTSKSPYSTADNPYIEKWRFQCDWVEDTPVIDNEGTIYVGGGYQALNRYLIAIHPNGTLKWRFKTEGLILGSSPAIAEDGTIYVGSWDDRLYAINTNGTLKWRSKITGGSIGSSPIISDDGTIYFGNAHTNLVAVNPDGSIKWKYGEGTGTYSDPCIGDDGTIYIGSDNSYLLAVYPDGSLRWVFPTGGAVKGPPSIGSDGTIYFGCYDTYVYAVNPDGTQKWKCYIGYGIATNPSIGSDGTIYVGGGKLYAIHSNGMQSWSFDIGEDAHIDSSSPAISADGTIYIGTNIGGPSDGGEIIAVNPDGTERWRKKIANKWIDSSPSIGEDGTLYIGSAYNMGIGYLHAFGPQETNEPPTSPEITGTTSGKTGNSYDYGFVSNDPDRNPILYYIDWGDGTHDGWTEDYDPGSGITLSHTWNNEKTYTIRAKAKDTFGLESDWSYLEVTMPRNRAINKLFFNFVVNYLNMFPLLQLLLGGFYNE